jgi:hypothetical protein
MRRVNARFPTFGNMVNNFGVGGKVPTLVCPITASPPTQQPLQVLHKDFQYPRKILTLKMETSTFVETLENLQRFK